MTALLGSSVTDDDEGLGVKSCFSDGRRRASTWERIAIFCGDGLDIRSIYKTKVRTVMIEEVKTANRVGSKLSSESHHYPFLI